MSDLGPSFRRLADTAEAAYSYEQVMCPDDYDRARLALALLEVEAALATAKSALLLANPER